MPSIKPLFPSSSQQCLRYIRSKIFLFLLAFPHCFISVLKTVKGAPLTSFSLAHQCNSKDNNSSLQCRVFDWAEGHFSSCVFSYPSYHKSVFTCISSYVYLNNFFLSRYVPLLACFTPSRPKLYCAVFFPRKWTHKNRALPARTGFCASIRRWATARNPFSTPSASTKSGGKGMVDDEGETDSVEVSTDTDALFLLLYRVWRARKWWKPRRFGCFPSSLPRASR